MEDYDLNQKVRNKRKMKPTFMGAAEKIRSIPKPEPIKLPEKVVQPKVNPVETLKKNLEEIKKEPDEIKKVPEIKLVKGFTVGVTEDNIIKLMPFGGANRLEMVGFSEYVRVKMEDILNQIGNTYMVDRLSIMRDLSEGVTAVATGVNSMLEKNKA